MTVFVITQRRLYWEHSVRRLVSVCDVGQGPTGGGFTPLLILPPPLFSFHGKTVKDEQATE